MANSKTNSTSNNAKITFLSNFKLISWPNFLGKDGVLGKFFAVVLVSLFLVALLVLGELLISLIWRGANV